MPDATAQGLEALCEEEFEGGGREGGGAETSLKNVS
jgi:hypothetical protein